MDNFNMESFLGKIEVNMRKVTWSEREFILSEDEEKSNWRELLYEDQDGLRNKQQQFKFYSWI